MNNNATVGDVFKDLLFLEFGSGAAGPMASRYFVQQGATVVKIESRARPDFLRYLNRGGEQALNNSPMFVLLNADKKSLALNMAEQAGRELAWRLIERADVVINNFAPGVMEKWGMEATAVRARNPAAVVASSSLFGATGPERNYPGFGGQGSAIAGFNQLTGQPGMEPHGPWATITDSLSPRYLAVALSAALLRRRRTGKGCSIDLSQIEAAVYSLSELVVRQGANDENIERRANSDQRMAPHGVYRCKGDDRWIAVAVLDDVRWKMLRELLGRPAWMMEEGLDKLELRLEQAEVLDRCLQEYTATRDADELSRELQEAGIEAAVVMDLARLDADPQLAARRYFTRVEHESLGELALERVGFTVSDMPAKIEQPGPDLGQHSSEVLRELLGLDQDEIDQLGEQGVLA
jgi:benzylsuccinate CoA-transferase BbsF subunit